MRRSAFSLLELLVVIAIMGVLVALLLPAVQKVRAAAERARCANNLKQLALAAHQYHDVQQSFPPGFFRAPGPWLDVKVYTLFIALLPYLEQDNLYQRWDFDHYGNNLGPYPTATAAQVIMIAVCPADYLPSPPVDQNDMTSNPRHWGLVSYGGNAGIRSTADQTKDGVFFESSQVRLADVTDGTSNTLLLGERNHWDPIYDALCPNDQLITNSWWAYAGTADILLSAAVPVNYQAPASATSCADVKADRLCAFGSRHPGGANFAFVDGSVHFLPDTISLSLLQALSTRASGESVEGY